MECAHCQPEQNGQRPVFWSYNLLAHHEAEHPSHHVPPMASCRSNPDECALVKAVGGERMSRLSAELKAMLAKAQALHRLSRLGRRSSKRQLLQLRRQVGLVGVVRSVRIEVKPSKSLQ
eukprot:7324495-Prymnesium_polylepis.3